MSFNENTRVKIPAILHLTKLGYKYLSLKDSVWDLETNVFTDIFNESIKKINKEKEDLDLRKIFEEVRLALSNEDLGKSFYELLIKGNDYKLIDFENFENNTFNIVTELTCKNGDDEFRPDITLLINGMPLAFVEVKKPNNRDGILAERERINKRFQNEKFRKFINMTQLLIFSNNMEYDKESITPIQGAFYSSTSTTSANFNCFREEDHNIFKQFENEVDPETENQILKDNNLISIKSSPEFIENKRYNTPTNRILTSLLSKERLGFILKFGIAYVKEKNGLEKHIMRYPQFFATQAIRNKIEEGVKRGIIWHTQGSGKTALTYYMVPFLTNYFSKKFIVPRFYFIVDRLDLLIQATSEFASRGLVVHTVNSKEELLEDFKRQSVVNNNFGQMEITVVNIQKFQDDVEVLKKSDYDLNIQRVYIIDEAHRSYNPKGSFLANLVTSDRDAMIIGLTGTPLIGKTYSKEVFGDYIHKYYYNSSIEDGYTLKLIREGIETSYEIKLKEALKEIELLKGGVDKRYVYSHDRFVEPMVDYIIEDFTKSRIMFGDKTIGGMVVCDSSEQAKNIASFFDSKYGPGSSKYLSRALILHDEGTKEDRKSKIDDFKAGKVDFLIVYNMLLTGFDAKRLKKLYLGRVVKDHNLLQTLTRVNRPYKDFRFGYVVDFADISSEFESTNRAYLQELQDELGPELRNYSNLFISKEEIENEIQKINETLFYFDITNAEIFSKQISEINDRKKVLDLKKALESAKNLFNVIKLMGYDELFSKLDFKKLNVLFNEVSNRLDILNLKDAIENGVDSTNLLNIALENVFFTFKKVSEDELSLVDKIKDEIRRTQEEFKRNFDPKDPEFSTLYEEFTKFFKERGIEETRQEDISENIGIINKIHKGISELNRKNSLLKAKYDNDAKYARIHKRISEKKNINTPESKIFESLMQIKKKTDEQVQNHERILDNYSYFSQMVMPFVMNEFTNNKVDVKTDVIKQINGYVVDEYINEYK